MLRHSSSLNNRCRADSSSIPGCPATRRSHSVSTLIAFEAVADTTATPISARRCRSRWPVSATAMPGSRRRSSATSGRTTARLPFSECTSPSSTSSVSAATYTASLRSGPVPSRGPLGPRLLPHLEGLDRVFDAQIAVADADTALEALADLGRVVLEPAQRVDREVVGDHHAVPDQPRLAVAVDRPGTDDAPGDVPDPRHPEDLPDLRRAELDLLELGLEQALERGLDLLDRLVDDRVVADVHALAPSQLARPLGRPDVEADDHRVRGDGQVHVVLGDRADAAADHAQADFLADIELEQRVLQGLDRAGHVALDDEQQFLTLAGLERRLQALERDPPRLGELGIALASLTAFGDLAGDPVVGDDQEVVARVGHRGQAEHHDRPGRQGLGDRVAVLVDHGAHPAERIAGDDRVADVQRAALHQHRGHRAAALVQVRLDRYALPVLRGVGAQVKGGVGGQDDRLKQAAEPGPLGGGHVHELRVAAELLGDEPVLGQLGPHPLRVGALLVDLVDRHHDRHAGRLRVVQRLSGLRLHAVVRRHHEHHEVGGLGPAGSHGGERLVARGVDEGDLAFIAVDLGGHLVGADVLGDAAGLAGHHVGVPDRVEQLGLAVVDMTHHRDHRRPGDQVGLVALVLAELDVEGLEQLAVLLLRRDDLDGVVQLRAEQLQGLVVDRLGRRDHLAQDQKHLDQRRRVGADLVGEVAQAGAPAEPDHLAVAGPDLDAADRRRLHVVELLTPLLLGLPAPGRTPAGTTEGTLGTAAAATAAARTRRPAAGPGARRSARTTGCAATARARARAAATAAGTAAGPGACSGTRAAAAAGTTT